MDPGFPPPVYTDAALGGFAVAASTPGPRHMLPKQRDPPSPVGAEHCGLHGQGFQARESMFKAPIGSSHPPKP